MCRRRPPRRSCYRPDRALSPSWARGRAVAASAPAIANVVTVVIKPHGSRDRSQAIQPVRMMEMPATFRHVTGSVGEGIGRTVVFPLDVLSTSSDVHVVFDRDVPLGSDFNAHSSCTDGRARFEVRKGRLKPIETATDCHQPLPDALHAFQSVSFPGPAGRWTTEAWQRAPGRATQNRSTRG